MAIPLKYLPRRLDLTGLDADEHRRRSDALYAEKIKRFPSVAGPSYLEGIEQRVAREMREGVA